MKGPDMKLFSVLTLTLFISACGNDGSTGTNGLVGNPGSAGIPGQDGYNSLTTVTRTNNIDSNICVSNNGVVLQSGLDTNRSFVLDASEVQQIGVVCDGAAGPAGPQGPQGDPGTPATVPQYSVDSIIDPCGDNPNLQDEVFIRLVNRSILVLFADNAAGNNPRLSLLAPGSYVTSDGSNCHVSVDANLIITDQLGNVYQ